MIIAVGSICFVIGGILGILTGIKAVHWVAEEGRIVLIEHAGR